MVCERGKCPGKTCISSYADVAGDSNLEIVRSLFAAKADWMLHFNARHELSHYITASTVLHCARSCPQNRPPSMTEAPCKSDGGSLFAAVKRRNFPKFETLQGSGMWREA